MASIEPMTVGMKMEEPNWQVLCLALTNHSMRALGHLEGSRPDLALEALRTARAVCDLVMRLRIETPTGLGDASRVVE